MPPIWNQTKLAALALLCSLPAIGQITVGPASLPNGKANAGYDVLFSASGGTAPYQYWIAMPEMPLGMNLNTSTGQFFGAPAFAGVQNFNVVVTDSSAPANTTTRAYSWNVMPGLRVGSDGIMTGKVGKPFYWDLGASGGTPPYTFSVLSGTLPPGITMSAGGILSGTPITNGSYRLQISAVDSAGVSGTGPLYFAFDGPGMVTTTTPSPIPDGRVGVPYSVQLSTTGGTPPYSYGLWADSSPIPAGLTLSSAGLVSGTPAADNGGSQFSVKVTDANSNVSQFYYAFKVWAKLAIDPAVIADAKEGMEYEQLLTAKGFAYPTQVMLVSGSLPVGVILKKIDDYGMVQLYGTPALPGTYPFALKAYDSTGLSITQNYTLKVINRTDIPIPLYPETVPPGYKMESYPTLSIQAGGGHSPFTYSIASGTLPVGMVLRESGLFGGSPMESGTFHFRAQVNDSSGRTGTRDYTLYIFAEHLAIMPDSLPNAKVGVPYSQTFTASGGTPYYAWVASNGPPGLSSTFDTGMYSGTAAEAGAYTLKVEVTDRQGKTGTRSYPFVVEGVALRILPEVLPKAKFNEPYSLTFTVEGGTPPYTFTSLGDACNAKGLTLSVAGVFSGTPVEAGVLGCYIQVADKNGATKTRGVNLTIEDALHYFPPSFPNGRVGSAYSYDLGAYPGQFPETVVVVSGSLPPGLAIRSTTYNNDLFGTPTTAGSYTFQLKITEGKGASVTTPPYTLVIDPEGVTFEPRTLPAAKVGHAYVVVFTGSGGVPPYTFSLSSGALPTGVSLSTSGALSGTVRGPVPPGDSRGFTIQVRDAAGATNTRYYVVAVTDDAALRILPETATDASLGQAYLLELATTGGTAPYVFSLLSGSLPAGLHLNSGGQISGTPATIAAGSVFRVGVRDSAGLTGYRDYVINVAAAGLQILPETAPDGIVDRVYSLNLSASGGRAPYRYSITSGSLPSGLILSGSLITGRPSDVQSTEFWVEARDADNRSGTRHYRVTINKDSGKIEIQPGGLESGKVAVAYAALFTATGGTPPYEFSVLSGALPGGLLLQTDGHLAGKPDKVGSYSFEVKAQDQAWTAGIRAYTLSIAANDEALSIETTSLPDGSASASYKTTLLAKGGTPPYRWSIDGGVIPAGITLSEDGVLSGTPKESSQYVFRVKVTDAKSQSATQSLGLRIGSKPDEPNRLFVEPATIVFRTRAGEATAPPRQCVALFATKSAVTVSGTLNASTSPWASVPNGPWLTPDSICVTPKPAALSAGTYTGELALSAEGVTLGTTSVPVTLIIEEAAAPKLSVSPRSLDIPVTLGAAAVRRAVMVSNDGGGELRFAVAAPSSAWLRLETTSGSAIPGRPEPVIFLVDAAGMTEGVSTAEITVSAGTDAQTVRVALAVSGGRGVLSLSRRALEFFVFQGSGAPEQQFVGVSNTGNEALSAAAEVETTPAEHWLRADVVPGYLEPGATGLLMVNVEPLNLAPGRYEARVNVRASFAANSPQTLPVAFTVLGEGDSVPRPPIGLVLSPAVPEGTVGLFAAPGRPLTFQTAISTEDGGKWLSVAPASGSIPGGGQVVVAVKASAPDAAPGVYRGTVQIGLSDGTVRTVNVEWIVYPAAGKTASMEAAAVVPSGSCDASRNLAVHSLSLGESFRAEVGRPQAIRVQVSTCSGSPLESAEVSFRARGQSQYLSRESAGVWSGTWVPDAAQKTAELEILASVPGSGNGISGRVRMQGQIADLPNGVPLPRLVVNAASPVKGGAVAPGSWVTIFGRGLSDSAKSAEAAPLPASLAGTDVTLGGKPLPLYYAGPGQVNALVPWKLDINTVHDLILRRQGVSSASIPVLVAAAAPGLFTINQQGTAQAAALIAGTRRIAAPEGSIEGALAGPATKGDYLEIYCNGLGPVENPPDDGAAASKVRLSRVQAAVTATIGGHPAEVLFAGLVPGSVGLYQVNLRIPQDSPSGREVPVIVSVGGTASNSATIAIQ